jgi:hypothetical protein
VHMQTCRWLAHARVPFVVTAAGAASRVGSQKGEGTLPHTVLSSSAPSNSHLAELVEILGESLHRLGLHLVQLTCCGKGARGAQKPWPRPGCHRSLGRAKVSKAEGD